MKAVLPSLCLLLATSLNADEIRLKDGRVLIGRVHISGQLAVIETRSGEMRVATDQIVRIRDEQELRAELTGLEQRADRNSPHTYLELARAARGYGLGPEMWRYLDRALRWQRDDKHAALRRFLGALEDEVLPARLHRAKVAQRVRELLFRIRPGTGPAMKAAVHEILANMPKAAGTLRRRARQASSGRQRLAALAAISDRPEKGSKEYVYRGAILDSQAAVRRDVMLMTAAQDRAQAAIHYLAPALTHENAEVRIRTADAYAVLGDASAISLLVAAGPVAAAAPTHGASVRAYMAVTSQQSFIRDFDVEIAQSAFIANPKVDVVQSGVVLDATVGAVITTRVRVVGAYRRALKKLTGSDPGPQTKVWSSWLADLRRN